MWRSRSSRSSISIARRDHTGPWTRVGRSASVRAETFRLPGTTGPPVACGHAPWAERRRPGGRRSSRERNRGGYIRAAVRFRVPRGHFIQPNAFSRATVARPRCVRASALFGPCPVARERIAGLLPLTVSTGRCSRTATTATSHALRLRVVPLPDCGVATNDRRRRPLISCRGKSLSPPELYLRAPPSAAA